MKPLRVLTFSTLFPSAARPRHGIFVSTRLRKLLATGEIDARVIAPVPWFPFKFDALGSYAAFARTPRFERTDGIDVHHPRYFMIPRIGMHAQPDWLAASALRAARQIIADGFDFELIDAHYFYPDGVAAARIAQQLGKPLAISARGSDINLIATMPRPRARILAAASQADALIAVSAKLGSAMVELGMAAQKIHVLRNGVDGDLFQPVDRPRERLGWNDDPTLLCVGNLVPEKGFDLALNVLARLPAATKLVIVGSGSERASLEAQARALGVGDRTLFLPTRSQSELAVLYNAADVLMLTSTREGWPNVLLEAMACGTPVVAVDVGGVREIVTASVAGRVVERSVDDVAAGVDAVLRQPPARRLVRDYALQFDWQSIAQAQVALYRSVCVRTDGPP